MSKAVPDILVIIPARGGSKGVPGKNIRPIAGKPLIVHSIEHALRSHFVTRTIVSTDDDGIAEIARLAGAEVIDRPAELATDTASSESSLLHVLEVLAEENYHPDLVVFLQCTSPIRGETDIDDAIRHLQAGEYDSVLSVCRSHRFLWRTKDGLAAPLNYDYRDRKPRQLLPDEFEENGSIYVCRRTVLADSHNRLGGRIGLFEMSRSASLEIDDELDFFLLEQLMDKDGKC